MHNAQSHSIPIALAFAALLCLSHRQSSCLAQASTVKSDEQVIIFPTAAHPSADGTRWIVPIHAWIFEPEDDDLLRSAFLDELADAMELDDDENVAANERFLQRARLFIVDNERDKKLEITIAGQEFILPPTSENGHTQTTITLASDDVLNHLRDNLLEVRVTTDDDDDRAFVGYVHVNQPCGPLVISDIDDTVKVSHVTNKIVMLRNTFLEPYQSVEGMAELFNAWRQQGASFHFVSSSPWQLYEPLSQMLKDAAFPPVVFHLKHVRLKDSTVLRLFDEPMEAKLKAIRDILATHTNREVTLVGDSGEQDPEIYGRIAREFADRQIRIFIRNITNDPADSPRYQRAFADVAPDHWKTFKDAKELMAAPNEADLRQNADSDS